jgi:hypothetical protein
MGLHGLLQEYLCFFQMQVMFVPHMKHAYEPPHSVAGIALHYFIAFRNILFLFCYYILLSLTHETTYFETLAVCSWTVVAVENCRE